jgi:hypothetical protein
VRGARRGRRVGAGQLPAPLSRHFFMTSRVPSCCRFAKLKAKKSVSSLLLPPLGEQVDDIMSTPFTVKLVRTEPAPAPPPPPAPAPTPTPPPAPAPTPTPAPPVEKIMEASTTPTANATTTTTPGSTGGGGGGEEGGRPKRTAATNARDLINGKRERPGFFNAEVGGAMQSSGIHRPIAFDTPGFVSTP